MVFNGHYGTVSAVKTVAIISHTLNVKAARPVPHGEMFTLSVRHLEYLMKEISYRLRFSAVGRILIRQGSVLGFSANRVWLVSRFYTFYIFFYIRSQYQRLTPSDYVLWWPSGLRRWSVDLEVRAI